MSGMTTREFIEGFVKGTLGRKNRCGRWSVIEQNGIETLRYSPEDVDEHEDLAYRLPNKSVISNANILEYVGRSVTWGRVRAPRYQVEEQTWLENAGATSIPFTLFKETNTDVRDFSWIVEPKAETVSESINIVSEPKFTQRHFSGACLFAIGNDTYLFDVDRDELREHGIFNPFLVKLPGKVKTIEEAYDMLMPDEVREAAYGGKEVRRQGEFFFIKQSDECPVQVDLSLDELAILRFPPSRFGFRLSTTMQRWRDEDIKPYAENESLTPDMMAFQHVALRYRAVAAKYSAGIPVQGIIGKGGSGSHSVEMFVKDGDTTFVSGKITQQRRQHREQILTGWWKVVPNTAVFSWTITGRVD